MSSGYALANARGKGHGGLKITITLLPRIAGNKSINGGLEGYCQIYEPQAWHLYHMDGEVDKKPCVMSYRCREIIL